MLPIRFDGQPLLTAERTTPTKFSTTTNPIRPASAFKPPRRLFLQFLRETQGPGLRGQYLRTVGDRRIVRCRIAASWSRNRTVRTARGLPDPARFRASCPNRSRFAGHGHVLQIFCSPAQLAETLALRIAESHEPLRADLRLAVAPKSSSCSRSKSTPSRPDFHRIFQAMVAISAANRIFAINNSLKRWAPFFDTTAEISSLDHSLYSFETNGRNAPRFPSTGFTESGRGSRPIDIAGPNRFPPEPTTRT